jgi:D-alanine-D-alanine ligase
MSTDEFLTYQDKYISKGSKAPVTKGMLSTNRIIPARISDDMREQVISLAKEVFRF